MNPTDWLLIIIATMLVIMFFERIAFVIFATVYLVIVIVDMLIGGVIGNRRT